MKQLIYFGAEWCGPCKMIKPQLQASGLNIRYIDVDASPDMAKYYSVQNIPVVILTGTNGEVLDKKVGNAISIASIKEMLK